MACDSFGCETLGAKTSGVAAGAAAPQPGWSIRTWHARLRRATAVRCAVVSPTDPFGISTRKALKSLEKHGKAKKKTQKGAQRMDFADFVACFDSINVCTSPLFSVLQAVACEVQPPCRCQKPLATLGAMASSGQSVAAAHSRCKVVGCWCAAMALRRCRGPRSQASVGRLVQRVSK